MTKQTPKDQPDATADTSSLTELLESMGDPVEVTRPAPDEIDPGQDHLVALAGDVELAAPLVRTGAGAIRWAWGKVKSNDDDYHGLCLRFVREAFNIDPLWPSAIVAWQEAERRRRTDVPGMIRRGHAVFWRGGEFGHVALGVGEGLCISTDVRDPGQANLCRIADIGAAWGYRLLGDTSELNEEQAPREVESPRVTTREWRIRRLRSAITTARGNDNQKAVEHLSRWLREIRDRADGD